MHAYKEWHPKQGMANCVLWREEGKDKDAFVDDIRGES